MLPLKLRLLFVAALAFLCASPLPLRAWRLEGGKIQPHTSPIPGRPEQSVPAGDLNGDGLDESVWRGGGRVEIRAAGALLWRSPADWQVIRARISDLDRDGTPELALLVWRAFQPWPVDEFLPHGGRIDAFQDRAGRSCHLILIGWRRGEFRELWAGSALADPLQDFLAADLDDDGKQELIALENRYINSQTAPAWALSVWGWNGFGFTLVDRVNGKFDNLMLLRLPDGRLAAATG